MKTTPHYLIAGLALACLLTAGCESDTPDSRGKPSSIKEGPTPPDITAGKKVKVGNNLYLQILPDDSRKILIDAKVCLREGQLELLLCKKNTKEYESILYADIDPFILHSTLIAAKAEAGSPVKFQPKYTPAHGTTIKVWLQYKDDKGKVVTVPAQEWIRDSKNKKQLKYDWVFAGSRTEPYPDDPKKPPFYAARDNGDVISVNNFPDSLMDLPIPDGVENRDQDFEPWTDRIPAKDTPVTVILEPVVKKK